MKRLLCLLASTSLTLCAFAAPPTPHFVASYAPCEDAGTDPSLAGSQCARVTVPQTYLNGRAESDDTVSLFVRKFPAEKQAQGTVWLIAGGPGESGASLYPFVASVRRSFPGFDLVVPDHRGTGFSTRLCPSEEAPGSAGGTRLMGAEWGTCFGRLIGHPELARPFSITNAAWDLKHLIEHAPSAGPSYVYGVSYGTQLVLRTLQLGDSTVAGVVLDSLVPLDKDPQWELGRRSQVVDDVGRELLSQCDARPECRALMGEPAEAALRKLLLSIADKPELLKAIPGQDLRQFLARLLDVPAARDRLPQLIHDLQQGRTTELAAVIKALEDFYARLGSYAQLPPSIPLVSIISISENTLRPGLTKAQIEAEEQGLLFVSPLAGLMAESALPTYARDGHFGQSPRKLPRTLVFSGTLDPKTHYKGAVSHVAELKKHGEVSLVSVAQGPHFALMTAAGCFERLTRAFVGGQAVADQRCGLDP